MDYKWYFEALKYEFTMKKLREINSFVIFIYKGLSVFMVCKLLCIADIRCGKIQSCKEDPLFLNHPLRSLTVCILCLFLSVNEGISTFLLPTRA